MITTWINIMLASLSDILLSMLDEENIIQFIYRRQFAITFYVLFYCILVIQAILYLYVFHYAQNFRKIY